MFLWLQNHVLVRLWEGTAAAVPSRTGVLPWGACKASRKHGNREAIHPGQCYKYTQRETVSDKAKS